MAENIVVPEKIYIGYSTRGKTEKLGFGTYYEDNAACRKRQVTINNWSSKGSPEIISNLPATGYKLSERVTHGGGWNDLNVFWRIVDPRGFELEISSGNLAKLFQYCDIDHGDIGGECVWGWDKGNGSKVVLLPVNSEIYKQSQVSTDRHNAKSLSFKDLKLGDEVHLKNDVKGTYFGKVNYGWYSDDFKEFGKITFESTYVFQTGDKELFYMRTPKVIAAKDGKKIYTPAEAEIHLNELLTKKVSITNAGTSYHHNRTAFFTYDDPTKAVVTFDLVDVDRDVVLKTLRDIGNQTHSTSLSHLTYYAQPIIAAHESKMKLLTASADARHYNYNNATSQLTEFLKGSSDNLAMQCVSIVDSPLLTPAVGLQAERNPNWRENDGHYLYRSRETYHVLRNIDLAQVEKFYLLQAKFKNYISSLHKY